MRTKSEVMTITLEQLAFFAALKDYRQFTMAAEHLNISQSTLSKQIKLLETEVGVPLFVRGRKGVSLTPEGEIFSGFALTTLRGKKALEQQLEEYTQPINNTILLGSMPIISSYGISDALCKFMLQYPEYHIKLTEKHVVDDLISDLEEGIIHLLFSATNLQDPYRFAEIPIADDRVVAVVSSQHPLAGRDTISMEELAGEPLIMLDAVARLRSRLDIAFAEAGFTPNVIFTHAYIESILTMVEQNVGVTLLHGGTVPARPGLHVLELTPPILSCIALVNKKKRPLSSAERTFRKFIASYFAE